MSDTDDLADGDADDDYTEEPGPSWRVRGADAWQCAFAGWRPDQRSMGVLLVALFLAGAISQLVTADLTWQRFTLDLGLGSDQFFGYQTPLSTKVAAAAQLLAIPVTLLVLAGGVGLALRQAWGRRLAITALGAVLLISVVEGIGEGLDLRGSETVRNAVLEFVSVLGAAAVLVAVLWSRPAAEDG